LGQDEAQAGGRNDDVRERGRERGSVTHPHGVATGSCIALMQILHSGALLFGGSGGVLRDSAM